MKIVLAETQHITLIETAFNEQQAQRPQRHIDYLAMPEVSNFHRDRVCRRVRQGGEDPLQLVFHQDRLAAILGVEPSPWHREHFGVPYYKIQPFYCFVTELEALQNLVGAIQDECLQAPQALYTTRIDAQDRALAYIMQHYGFIQVGTSLRFSLHNQKKQVDILPSTQYDFLNIRDFRADDLAAVREIAESNHGFSHFYQEARFSRQSVQSIFGKWIERCAQGAAAKILVAEQNNRAVGFATLLLSQALEPYIQKRIGVIDFIVADRRVQGRGIGARLLEQALQWLFEHAEVVELRTMAENLRAIRFYEKHGFRILSADLHFHFWTETESFSSLGTG